MFGRDATEMPNQSVMSRNVMRAVTRVQDALANQCLAIGAAEFLQRSCAGLVVAVMNVKFRHREGFIAYFAAFLTR